MKDEYNLGKKEILEQKIRNFVCLLKNEKRAVSLQKKLPSFDIARKMCEGYGTDTIFNKVKEAVLEVKAGKACYERDGCLFYEQDYYLQLVAILYKIFLECGKLNIVDFGGSLGSMYYQNRNMILPHISEISWNIIEQEHFVDWGRVNLEDDILKFCYTLDEVKNFNCVIFGSSLQYIENHIEYLEKISSRRCKYIILDRTAVCDEAWVSIECVHEPIYEAKYPVRIFDEHGLITLLEGFGYKLELGWIKDISEVFIVQNKLVRQKSFLFTLK